MCFEETYQLQEMFSQGGVRGHGSSRRFQPEVRESDGKLDMC